MVENGNKTSTNLKKESKLSFSFLLKTELWIREYNHFEASYAEEKQMRKKTHISNWSSIVADKTKRIEFGTISEKTGADRY